MLRFVRCIEQNQQQLAKLTAACESLSATMSNTVWNGLSLKKPGSNSFGFFDDSISCSESGICSGLLLHLAGGAITTVGYGIHFANVDVRICKSALKFLEPSLHFRSHREVPKPPEIRAHIVAHVTDFCGCGDCTEYRGM